MFREIHIKYPELDQQRLIHEANRRMINRMVVDLTRQTIKNIKDNQIQTVEDIRNLGKPVVEFSKTMQANVDAIKEFLGAHMYNHYKVSRMTNKARHIVKDLFEVLHASPDCLPTRWRHLAEAATTDSERAEIVSDYIAGMTDRYAVDEHKKLFDIEHQS
jgi:dGTPase